MKKTSMPEEGLEWNLGDQADTGIKGRRGRGLGGFSWSRAARDYMKAFLGGKTKRRTRGFKDFQVVLAGTGKSVKGVPTGGWGGLQGKTMEKKR